MDRAVIRVGLGQPRLVPKESAKAISRAQFKFGIHLDGFKRAHFNANLTTHTDGNIDIEHRRIKLRLAHGIRLFVFAFFNVDALRRAFLLADLAAHTAHTSLPVVAVVDKKGEVSRRFDLRQPLLWILHGCQAVFADVAAKKIPGRLYKTFRDALTQHDAHTLYSEIPRRSFDYVSHGLFSSSQVYRSTSPSTISMVPKMTITSDTFDPRHISSNTVRLIKLGGRTR